MNEQKRVEPPDPFEERSRALFLESVEGLDFALPRWRPPFPRKTEAPSKVPAIMAEKPMKTRMAAQWPSTLATIAHKRDSPGASRTARFGFAMRFRGAVQSCHKVGLCPAPRGWYHEWMVTLTERAAEHVLALMREDPEALGSFQRQHALVARPILHERRAAAQPVGEIADGERVSFGGIVFHDDAEIRQHQERRPPRAGRNEQEGAVVAMGKRLSSGAPHAEILPFAHRHLL